jgi:hypothetical protein
MGPGISYREGRQTKSGDHRSASTWAQTSYKAKVSETTKLVTEIGGSLPMTSQIAIWPRVHCIYV